MPILQMNPCIPAVKMTWIDLNAFYLSNGKETLLNFIELLDKGRFGIGL